METETLQSDDKKNQKYTSEFAKTGDYPDILHEQLEILQLFVSDVYGHKGGRVPPHRLQAVLVKTGEARS